MGNFLKRIISSLKKFFGFGSDQPTPDVVPEPVNPPVIQNPPKEPTPVENTPLPPNVVEVPLPAPPVVKPPVVVPVPTPDPVIIPPVVVDPKPKIETLGSGSGDLNLPNVSGKVIKIKPGPYKSINIGECTDSKIDATGVQMAKDGSVYFKKAATNVEFFGPKWNGHYYRAIFIQAQMKKLYLHDLSFKDVNNYVISDEWGDVWDGTDKTAKADWTFENFIFENCGQGFSSKGGIDVEGNKITGMFKNFKMKGVTVKNCPNMGSIVWMGACDWYDISDVTIDGMNMNFPDKNVPNGPHNGIFSITGNGKLHDVKCQNHQGNLIRGWNISFSKTPATTEIYSNRVFKSWKYSAFELQTPPHLLKFLANNKDKYTFANAKVYGNVAGKLSKSKDWEGQMLDLYTLGGGSVSYYDNIGFEMYASSPQYHPVTNMINNMSDAKVIEYNNKYYKTQAESGIVIDGDNPEPPKGNPVTETPPVKEPVIVPMPKPEPLPPAAKTLKDSSVIIGCATKEYLLKAKDPAYAKVLKTQFRSITSENSMKWGHIHPERNKWAFTDADTFMTFGRENNMRRHGQTFIWNKDVPAWLKKLTKAEAESELRNHIATLMARYKDVSGWDVVNEILESNGKFKSSFWLEKFGEDFAPMAFHMAHEIDPSKLLFANDYDLETGSAKVGVYLKLIDKWKKAGVPIHGIGSQMHTVLRMNVKTYTDNLKKFADMGLQVHITELDMTVDYGQTSKSVKDDKGKIIKLFPFTKELKQDQAEKYAAIAAGYKQSVPVKQQYGITLWSATHGQNFMNKEFPKDYPAIFQNDYTPEPAVDAILKATL